MSEPLFVYSLGLVHASVCTNLPKSQVADEMNRVSPTGIPSDWEISPAETFKEGEPNGRACDQKPARHHYLMEC